MVEVGIQNFTFYQLFYIVSSLNHSVLLGIDFLKRASCRIDLLTDSVSLLANKVFLPLQTLKPQTVLLRSTENLFFFHRKQ